MLYVGQNLKFVSKTAEIIPEGSLPVTDEMAVYAKQCLNRWITVYNKRYYPTFGTEVPTIIFDEELVFVLIGDILCEEILHGIFICLERDKNSLHVRIEGT